MFGLLKRGLKYIGLFFGFLPLVGCGQEAVVDLERFDHVDSYIVEILPVLDETKFDFNIWSQDLTSAEKKEWLSMNAVRIRKINQLFLTSDFPDYAEMESWTVPVTDSENNEWTIHGEELAAALEMLVPAGEQVVLLIGQIAQTDDQIVLAGKKEELGSALDQALAAAELLRNIFRR